MGAQQTMSRRSEGARGDERKRKKESRWPMASPLKINLADRIVALGRAPPCGPGENKTPLIRY